MISDPTLTQKNILNAIKDVADWKLLGIQLGIKGSKLQEIDANNSGQIANCRLDLINYWLDSDVSASWQELITALKEIDEHVLAEEIRALYYPQNEGTCITLHWECIDSICVQT